MNSNRLLLLADKLDRQQFAVQSAFDLDAWFAMPYDEHFVADVPPTTNEILVIGNCEFKPVDPSMVSCGTSACAVGHAALMPEFRAEGLTLVLPCRPEDGESAIPHYQGDFGWSAVRSFFGINSHAAHQLFNFIRYDGAPATAQDVAARIRALVSLDKAEGELIAAALSEVKA